MLPNTIIGSVVLGQNVKPFVIDTASGRVRTGSYEDADPMQANMSGMEHSAVDGQVRSSVSGVSAVRIGEYRCPTCARWIDVVKNPDDWSGGTCARC